MIAPLAFNIVVFIIFGFLFSVWEPSTYLNIFFKMVFLVMGLWTAINIARMFTGSSSIVMLFNQFFA